MNDPCPLCNSARCQIEALAEGYQFCNTMKFVFKTDARGRVIEWATTQHSHPKGFSRDASVSSRIEVRQTAQRK